MKFSIIAAVLAASFPAWSATGFKVPLATQGPLALPQVGCARLLQGTPRPTQTLQDLFTSAQNDAQTLLVLSDAVQEKASRFGEFLSLLQSSYNALRPKEATELRIAALRVLEDDSAQWFKDWVSPYFKEVMLQERGLPEGLSLSTRDPSPVGLTDLLLQGALLNHYRHWGLKKIRVEFHVERTSPAELAAFFSALTHFVQNAALESIDLEFANTLPNEALSLQLTQFLTELSSVPAVRDRLREISLANPGTLPVHLESSAFTAIAHFNQLEFLALSSWRTMDVEDLTHILGMPRIRSLWLENIQLSDDHLLAISQNTTLRRLTIRDAGLRGGQTQILGTMRLRALDLSLNEVDSIDIGAISQISELQKLSLARNPYSTRPTTRWSNRALRQIANLRELRLLDVSGVSLLEVDLRHLASMPLLTEIVANQTRFDASGFHAVIRNPHLRSLSFRGTQLPFATATFENAPLLAALDLQGAQVNPQLLRSALNLRRIVFFTPPQGSALVLPKIVP